MEGIRAGCRLSFSFRSLGLRSQDSTAEQVEVCTPIPLALDEFHPVHMPLHGAIGPLGRQRRFDGGIVRTNAMGQRHERGQPAHLGIDQLGSECRHISRGNERSESLHQLITGGQPLVLR